MVPIRQETIKVWYTKAQELKDLVLVCRILGGEVQSGLKLLVDRPGTAEDYYGLTLLQTL